VWFEVSCFFIKDKPASISTSRCIQPRGIRDSELLDSKPQTRVSKIQEKPENRERKLEN